MVSHHHAGHQMGADEISLTCSDKQCFGKVRHEGLDKMSLSFTKNLSLDRELTYQEARVSFPIFQLIPPNEGPVVNRITVEHKIDPSMSIDAGEVNIKIDPNLPWAGLVSEDADHMGMLIRMQCGFDLSSKRMN